MGVVPGKSWEKHQAQLNESLCGPCVNQYSFATHKEHFEAHKIEADEDADGDHATRATCIIHNATYRQVKPLKWLNVLVELIKKQTF